MSRLSVLKRPLYHFRFQFTSRIWKSTENLHCNSHSQTKNFLKKSYQNHLKIISNSQIHDFVLWFRHDPLNESYPNHRWQIRKYDPDVVCFLVLSLLWFSCDSGMCYYLRRQQSMRLKWFVNCQINWPLRIKISA